MSAVCRLPGRIRERMLSFRYETSSNCRPQPPRVSHREWQSEFHILSYRFYWRRVGESNSCTRICNPLRNHSANSPLSPGRDRRTPIKACVRFGLSRFLEGLSSPVCVIRAALFVCPCPALLTAKLPAYRHSQARRAEDDDLPRSKYSQNR